ncbi:FAD-dependent monooxygenase [Streptomyces sp. DSM 41972]|uniref:FAD-dependent monooxygenase n=1 Tax=Streptomyces althioticus subsp. attaecolombicae TaxID=3075534 RepID=A0ABU3I307_9ACTN|nr:FAD-dependent monooxygenase [Streptomyces sp. DSM 41972]SCE12787.1 3-(3-hydroxy-phenyl)propionate hydroxylase [Streptomyces sp. di50b]SCE53774.1 3-(3-hydroxy-phenyl)propionate hydroxylase [Streptomyces sp. di188]
MDPVIVVGAGPVGLTLALALARQDVPCVVLDEGPGKDEPRPARTVVLREDTAALMERLTGLSLDHAGFRWAGWRAMRRKQVTNEVGFEDARAAPLHIAQHVLTGALRAALENERLVRIAVDSRLDALKQERSGVTAHTRGASGTWWRGSYLVGCDGPRSTVRKLQDIRFPGRTAVERHAVAALRTELPWQDEALLHRSPPWRTSGPSAGEIIARPLPDEVWRLDWLLPPGKDLVTPEMLLTRIRETLAGWNGGTVPPYELLDTGVHTVHHRLARRWRAKRVFLAGDAAHLLGALGTHGLDEGLRDADNLAWKLALAWHHGPHEALLDSYQTERRALVASRLRAADQALPLLRGGGGLRTYVPGSSRSLDTLLMDGHLGRGALGSPGTYADSPLAPGRLEGEAPVATVPGAAVTDVIVTAEDGTFVRLRDRLGRGALLVVLVAPGTGVWERRHWVSAGIMPRLAAAVSALPHRAELLVAESYPGAAAHTVLLVRPDGHLVTALSGVRPADMYAAAETALGGPATATASKAGADAQAGAREDAGAGSR